MRRSRGHYRRSAVRGNCIAAIPVIPPFPFQSGPFPYFPLGSPPCMPSPVPWGPPVNYNVVNFPVRVAGREQCIRQPIDNTLIPTFPKPRRNVLSLGSWNTFNQNGRPKHTSTCTVVCCCSFGEGDSLQRVFSVSLGKSCSKHAEKKALEKVIDIENEHCRDLRKLILICSSSPCWSCAEDMITFVRSRGFSMNLYLTALQKEINPNKNSISLLASVGIHVLIVNDHVWSYLSRLLSHSEGKKDTNSPDLTGVSIVDRKAWDNVWSDQLEAILRHNLPGILNSESLLSKFSRVRDEIAAQTQNND